MILKHTYRSAVAFLLCALTSCGSNTNPNPNEQKTDSAHVTTSAPVPIAIKSLQWLVGKWQSKTPQGISFENWVAINDSVYSGTAGFIKGNDTTVFETIALEQKGGELHYIPTVKDQNDGKPIPFELALAAGDSFVFSNPQHDFPDMITYRMISEKELIARISGKIKGSQYEESFPMKKVE